MRQFNTLTGFLLSKSNNPTTDDTVYFQGYDAIGDGGAATWQHNGITGQTPSQTPAQLGDALLNDGNGNQWGFVGEELNVLAIGGLLDGTDNTAITNAFAAFSNRTAKTVVIPEGVYTSGQLLASAISVIVKGRGINSTTFKLKDSDGANAAQVTGATGRISLSDMTIDGNRDNQSSGHGVRSGGCESLRLKNIKIKDAYSYGIGLQQGANKDCKWENIEIENCGSDGIDIKDRDFGNETIYINNLIVKNHGMVDITSPAIDVRGKVMVDGYDFTVLGENIGIRYRLYSENGTEGSGVFTNGSISGDGASTSQGVVFSSENPACVVSGVIFKNVFQVAAVASNSVGGILTGFSATGIYGGDTLTVAGKDFRASSGYIQNTSTSSRVTDVESSSVNAQLVDIFWDDTTSNGSPIRVQAGAVDTLINGTLRGGVLGDSGTNTTDELRII